MVKKLKKIRMVLGIKQTEFADSLEISEVSLRNYEKSKHSINFDVLEKLKSKYNLNCNWLIDDSGNMFLTETKLSSNICNSDYIIPQYDIKASAGCGNIVNQENIVNFISFKKDWLKRYLNVSPKDIFLLEVDGDSMEPTLKNKDIVLVNTQMKQPIKEGIYIIRDQDSLLIKRIQKIGNILKIISDNKLYDNINYRLI